ncbi:putative membrane-associated kinase regulator 4 [Glycine soja]|uniref:Putative membrane-associated kinase regulator 4 n=1 Tax=Glycine soja TaxID=3848 RepID=A0A445FHT7_GLYSO|nr:putative membrane-associated kinase regulator 4 [Glycine soja]
MATKKVSSVHVDEDYIDIELRSSSPNSFSYSLDTPQQNNNREFEFQNKEESTTSPADELFYKGKLLPLHLPPRLEMVEKLLENADATFGFSRSQSSLEDSRFRLHSTNATSPLESCNISPSESRRVSSCESLPSEYQFDWSSEIEGLVSDHHHHQHVPNKHTKQKQFWLAQRFKASKIYLKSLFSKSGCSDKSCASDAAASKVGEVKKPKCKDDATKSKNKNKSPFELFCDNKHRSQRSCAVKNSDMHENGFFDSSSRRSFSGVIQRHYASKASSLSTSSSGSSSSSSSFSLSSAGSYELQLFNRSISAELENSIESAIAHCKKSQQKGGSDKILNDCFRLSPAIILSESTEITDSCIFQGSRQFKKKKKAPTQQIFVGVMVSWASISSKSLQLAIVTSNSQAIAVPPMENIASHKPNPALRILNKEMNVSLLWWLLCSSHTTIGMHY